MSFPDFATFFPEKYQGRWYEIGKYYLIYEEGCTGATADYRLVDDQTIRLVNTCLEDGQPIRKDFGTAKLTNFPGQFILSFDRFRGDPSFDSIYRVLWTDYENYAFVGDRDESEENYFILSRDPKLNLADLDFIYAQTQHLGFDPEQVLINPDALDDI